MDNERGNIEVSLPGAGESEPTILEVINRNTITNISDIESQIETDTETETTTSPQSSHQPLENIIEEDIEKNVLNTRNIESKNTLTTEELHKIAKDKLGNISLNNKNNNQDIDEKIDSGNILDIESHLIETFENFSVSEESDNSGVAIRECQPATDEYKRCSQIETETSPKTIIEIEPSIPIALKPIELDLDININKQFGIETTETINDKIISDNNLKEQNNKFIVNEQANVINNLISHIEEKKNDYTKSVDNYQLNDLNQKDLIKDNITIIECPISGDNNSIGINGLQNCLTPLEEEEKKKLLDSLPHLDENDSNNLSIQAKKEYYQLLRDYLDKHQDDRPPIPLKTYRWEDLRRAKEKGGYPWTHLYKRPLGPDEEPEIVLLLRKSQEFRFSSESPKSLKKVRIHDQVLIKETERYINDLSDTEDNPLEIITENIKNIEDNHSINSESAASLPSEFISKKSKLSKLKGILKRNSNTNTNETKVNSPNKSGNKKRDTIADGEDKHNLHSESAIPSKSDSVLEDKKSKLNKLKGLVKRQNSDASNKKPKEATSIFYSDSPDDTTADANNQSPLSGSKADKSNKFIDTVKGGKNIDSEKIDEKEISLRSHTVPSKPSQSETEAKEDSHSIHSESAIFDSRIKKSKLSKLKGFVKRRDNIQEDNKSIQSESALSRKSDSVLVGKSSKLKKLQRVFKIGKAVEKKEDNSEIPEIISTKENTQITPTESGLTESVPESKKLGKIEGLIKRKSENKKKETEQEDTKSVNSESAVSTKSDSTLERKKLKLSKLKGIFKSKQGDENQKPEEIEKTLTDLDEPGIPDVSNNSESTLERKKTKLNNLKEIFKGKQDSENKKPEEIEKILTDLDEPSTPDISNNSESTLEDKKIKLRDLKETFIGKQDSATKKPEEQEKTLQVLDTQISPDVPTKSDSTLERKKSKLSNFKDIFKGKQDSESKKLEEIEKTLTDLDEPITSEILTKSDSTLERKKSKLSNLKEIFKGKQDSENKKPEEIEKILTDLDEPSTPDVSNNSESTLEHKKIKLSDLKETFIGKQDSATKKPEEQEKTLQVLDTQISPDVPTKSDSTLERKKSKLSNFKDIFKGKQDSESKKLEEIEKTLTDLNEPITSEVLTKSDSTLERKKSKLSNLKEIFKVKQDIQKAEDHEKPLTDLEEPTSPDTEETQSTHSETQTSTSVPKTKPTNLKKLKGIVKRKSAAKKPRSKKFISTSPDEVNSTESKSEDSPEKEKCCRPIMDKLKNLTDKQFKKRNIKKVSLKDAEKIVLEEEQKILKLRESPKSVRGEIPKFVEKQDSEDLLEIVQLEESPSQKRKEPTSSILIPDEIIEISSHTVKVQERQENIDPSITPEPTVSEILEAELKSTPPVKALRKMKAHIYEDIENNEPITIEMKIDEILQLASVEALKKSLAAQDQNILKDIESNKQIPLDRMGSSEEEIEKTIMSSNDKNHLAPISSIDSASSDEQEKRTQLSPVAEESDICSTDGKDIIIVEENHELDVKSALKREPSPSPSIGDKKVTFSHVEDDAEPHREDIEIPEELKGMPNRWSTMK